MDAKEMLRKEIERFKKLTPEQHLEIARKMVEGLAKLRKK
jgi:hypothetical protein